MRTKCLIISLLLCTNSVLSQTELQMTSAGTQKNIREHQKTAYRGIIEAGYALGLGKYGMNNLRLNFINGVSLNPYFSIGLGLGLRRKDEPDEFYEDFREWPSIGDDRLYAIFLDLRSNLLRNNVSPFIAMDIGGYFGIYGLWAGVKSGFLVNPSCGVRYKISDSLFPHILAPNADASVSILAKLAS